MATINDTGLGEFIKQAISRNGWTLRNAALKIGVSPAYLSKLVNKKADSNPKNSTLEKIAEGLRIEREAIYTAAGYTPVSNSNPEPATNLVIADERIPVYGKIHAGEPTHATQHIIGYTPATSEIIDNYGQRSLFALQIEGDSMSRDLPDGFTAVFSRDAPVENGDIVAVLIDHEDAAIKRFKETSMAVIFEPNSYNPVYKPIIFQKSGEQDFEILGKYLYATSMPI